MTGFVLRHARDAVRSPALRVCAGLALLLAVGAGSLPVPPVLGGLGVAGLTFGLLLALTIAAAGAHVLARDRGTGIELWMGALRPAPWQRRLAVLVATTLGCLLAGGLGGALAIPAASTGLRTAAPLDIGAGVVLCRPGGERTQGAPFVLRLDPVAAGSRLVLDVRPWRMRLDQRVDYTRLAWTVDRTEPDERRISVRQPIQIDLPAGARQVELRLLERGTDLRVTAARVAGPGLGRTGPLLYAGLLIGLAAACVVPVGVLLSRATYGATAAGFALTWFLFGSLMGPMRALATRWGGESLPATSEWVFVAGQYVAPPLPTFDLVAHLGDGRVPLLEVAQVVPMCVYLLVTAALVLVPFESRPQRRRLAAWFHGA